MKTLFRFAMAAALAGGLVNMLIKMRDRPDRAMPDDQTDYDQTDYGENLSATDATISQQRSPTGDVYSPDHLRDRDFTSMPG